MEALHNIKPHKPRIPFYSTVMGCEWEGLLNSSYWWKNIRQPVLFEKSLSEMISKGCNIFIEVGPHPVLAKSITELMYLNRCKGISLYTLRTEKRANKKL